MINPFAGHKPSPPVVEVVVPKQPVGDKPIMNFNFNGSKWFAPR